jgi:hypothetical protein
MKKILIAGALVCLTVVAVAQSDQSKDKAPAQGQAASPRDTASGQASGKRMHKPMLVTNDDSSSRLLPTVNKSKPEASDDWQAKSATSDPKGGKGQTHVAAGDVNGDGVAANAKNSGHATETLKSATVSSSVTQPRDVATGQMSGKRQHQPVTAATDSDAKAAKK